MFRSPSRFSARFRNVLPSTVAYGSVYDHSERANNDSSSTFAIVPSAQTRLIYPRGQSRFDDCHSTDRRRSARVLRRRLQTVHRACEVDFESEIPDTFPLFERVCIFRGLIRYLRPVSIANPFRTRTGTSRYACFAGPVYTRRRRIRRAKCPGTYIRSPVDGPLGRCARLSTGDGPPHFHSDRSATVRRTIAALGRGRCHYGCTRLFTVEKSTDKQCLSVDCIPRTGSTIPNRRWTVVVRRIAPGIVRYQS